MPTSNDEAVARMLKKAMDRMHKKNQRDMALHFPIPPKMTAYSSWSSETRYPVLCPGVPDPKKIYKGNVDHWSIQRVKGSINVAKRKKSDIDAGTPISVQGLSDPANMFIWNSERKWRLPHKSFSDLCLQGLNGQLPGGMSKGYSKGLREKWTLNPFYSHAKADFPYWPYEKDSPLERPNVEKKMITSITALPPHNLKSVKANAVKIKKQKRTCLAI